MHPKRHLKILGGWLLGLALATLTWGYVFITDSSGIYAVTWPSGSIPFQVKLATSPALSDGTSQSSSVVAAMTTWNAQLGTVQFAPQVLAPGAYAVGNDVNEIVMDSTMAGQAFGSNVLAVTLSFRDGNTTVESDLIFNTAYTWDSFRGGQLPGKQDIRRVAIHELGHVLGLDHPDQHGQTGLTAIMNSAVSYSPPIDTMQSDDIAGAQALYGAPGVIPANNNFANATTITLSGNAAQMTGTNVAATAQLGEPAHAGETARHSVWWKWTAPADGSVTITTLGSNFDTVMAVYTGTAVSALTPVVANDDAQSGVIRTSAVALTAVSGTTYYIAIDGWDGITGLITLNLNFAPPDQPVPPSIVAQPVSRVVEIGATVSFSVMATGQAPLSFQWRFNGTDIPGATGSSYTLTNVQESDVGNYTVKVSNSLDFVVSNTATLGVNPGIVAVAAAGGSTFFLRGDGRRWALGYNNYGQLGDGTINNRSEPVQAGDNVALMAGGSGESFFAGLDGSLWATGMGAGTLAGLSTAQQLAPVPVINGSNVAALGAGEGALYFVRADGTLWSAGLNNSGQLGDGTNVSKDVPVQVATGVAAVAGGSSHAIFLKEDGSVWGVGSGTALGPGWVNPGNLFYSNAQYTPLLLAYDAVAIAAGANSCEFLLSDGTLWETNPLRQIDSNVIRMTRNSQNVGHLLYLKTDNTLWGVGHNDKGQLGDGTTTDRSTPVQVASGVWNMAVGTGHSVFIKMDGSLWGMGDATYSQIKSQPGFRSLLPVKIAGGPLSPPSAPTAVVASKGAVLGLVRVSWAAVTGASGYEIWRNSVNDPATATKLATIFDRSIYYDASVSAAAQYYYWVKAINPAGGSGFSVSDLGHALAATAPAFTIQPQDTSYTFGSNAPGPTFTVAASGSPAPHYQWQISPAGSSNWSDLTQASPYLGFRTTTLAFSGTVTTALSGNRYRCVATNVGGSTISNIASLTVTSTPPQIITHPANLRVLLGGGGGFSVSWNSPYEATFQWRRNGTDIPGATNSQLLLANVQPGDEGNYSVLVSTSAGSALSNTATLEIAPDVSVLSSAARNGISVFVRDDNTLWGMGLPSYGAAGWMVVDSRWPSQLARDVTRVVQGDKFTVFLKTDGSLWFLGRDFPVSDGPNGGYNSKTTATMIASDVVDVSAGYNHIAFAKSDASLWSMGRNDQGQLGDGTNSSRAAPVQIAQNVAKVTATPYGTFFVQQDQTLWGTGQNNSGQLGDGTVTGRNQPVQIATGVQAVTGSSSHTIFLKNDGTMWGMGINYSGELGTTVPPPVIVNYILVSGQQTTPVQIAAGIGAIMAAAGVSIFEKTDGTCWAMGSGQYGRLGNGATTNTSFPVQIPDADISRSALGEDNVLFVRADGSLWAAGLNYNGQLGNGTTVAHVDQRLVVRGPPLSVVAPAILSQPVNVIVNAGQNAGFTVTASGTLPLGYQWRKDGSNLANGGSISGATSATLTITGAQAGDAGSYDVVVSNGGGSVNSNAGTLTVITPPVINTRPLSRMVVTGQPVTFTVSASGSGLSYQWMRRGQTIVGATGPSLSISNAALSDRGVYWVEITNDHGQKVRTYFFLNVVGSNGTVVAWGYSNEGRTTVPAGLVGVASISASNHSLALKTDGTIVAWGPNNVGECDVPASLSNVVGVAAGNGFSLALKGDGTVVAWGFNDLGQTTLPVGLIDVIALSASHTFSHSLALKADGTVVAWGSNSNGQVTVPVGLSDVVGISAGETHSLALKADGTVVAWGDNTYGQSNVPAGLTDVVAVAAGGKFSAALKANGNVVAWGPGNFGETSTGSLANIVALAAANQNGIYLKSDGAVVALGYTGFSQSAIPAGLSNVTDVAHGDLYVLALVQLPVAPTITTHPGNQSVASGQSASFAVVASGSPLNYQWRKSGSNLTDGGKVSGSTTATLTITGAQAGDAGNYDVVVSNSAGSVTSDVATLTVGQLSQTISFGALADRAFNATPITLSATASSGLPVTFSVFSGPANVTGDSLTLSGTGVVTVRASQAGDSTYAAAPDVDRSFTVTGSFDSWWLSKFNSTERGDANISGPNAVYGQDGLPNLVKYALGLEPKQNITTGLPAVSTSGGNWIYTYTRPSSMTEVTYSVEVSTDLVNWTTSGVTHGFVSTSGGMDTWAATYPLNLSGNVYFRLKVERP